MDAGDRALLGRVPPVLFSWSSALRVPARAHTHTLDTDRGCILGSNWGQPPAEILGQAWGVAGVALAGGLNVGNSQGYAVVFIWEAQMPTQGGSHPWAL